MKPKVKAWQPGLFRVGGELWCLWTDERQIHFSKLKNTRLFDGTTANDPAPGEPHHEGAKWRNRLLFSPSPHAENPLPVFDGKSWRLFVGNKGIVTSLGPNRRTRVIVPVTLIQRDGDFAEKFERPRRDAVIYTDDLGSTWKWSRGVANGTGNPQASVWEGTIWQAGRRLHMVSRNNRRSVLYQVFPDRFAPGGGRPARAAGADVRGELGHPASRTPSPTTCTSATAVISEVCRRGWTTSRRSASTGSTLNPIFPARRRTTPLQTRRRSTSWTRSSAATRALVELAAAMHERGLRLVGDLTPNHTGHTHEWFVAAQADEDAPEHGFYHWIDWPDSYAAALAGSPRSGP